MIFFDATYINLSYEDLCLNFFKIKVKLQAFYSISKLFIYLFFWKYQRICILKGGATITSIFLQIAVGFLGILQKIPNKSIGINL